ncbi:MAG: ATP-dependent 6-phosphofructokinase [Acidimicrobiaceae bacterium]|nr:ATP-dependent 6-phosphofructokinase [Acidimicrobiaceae bacterium]MDE0606177.1 ATP-dependent 6-phosphofructokinase [Acidimicrobiaceae bacterium]
MKVGVLTGGGDCPGLNAVIRGVVRKAERAYGDEVVGFLDGWRGLLDDRRMPLDVEACRGLVTRGGTVLGTSRDQPYMFDDGVERVKATMARHDVEALIVIGGEGTLSAAARVHADGVDLVGVPKTIDNDVAGTDRTFGFDTAVQTATDAIERLRTTAESHDRVIVVEVMGRHVGHIATWAGIAGGATIVLVPEEPFDISEICESLKRRHRRGRFSSIVVVAEGATPAPGTLDVAEPGIDEYGHARLGGIGNVVAEEIEQRTGFETRVTVLGHVQRGGTPSALDRVLSTWYGVAAMTAVHEGDFGTMVAFRHNKVVRVRLDECVGPLKYTQPDLLAVARTFFP